jgi:Rps23 Pro-64 3,4-dihydroxylase Tpa1-like proline 4-hydroxylase
MKTKSPLAYDKLVYNDFESLAKGFQSAQPFPHVVVDNFLNLELAQAIEKEFPDIDDERWYKYNNAIENKKALNNWEIFGPLTYNLMTYLNSPAFVSKVQMLFGDVTLYPDYGLNGGGYHLHKSGGKLNVHLDYSIHPKMNLERRVNIILYLTEGWDEAWGGHVSLWTNDEEKHQPKEMIEKVAPQFNRAVIFDTTCNSWHGLPETITCPDDQARKSLAIYYLSQPNEKAPDRGKALFAPFEDQKDDQDVLDLIDKRSNVKTAGQVWKKD